MGNTAPSKKLFWFVQFIQNPKYFINSKIVKKVEILLMPVNWNLNRLKVWCDQSNSFIMFIVQHLDIVSY